MIWIVAAMLSIIIAGLLAWPLIRRADSVDDRAEFDLRIYKDQLRELERDEARGVIDGEQAKAARFEIERRILAADDARQTAQPPGPAARAVLVAFVIAAPVAAIALYAQTGNPGVPDFPFAARNLPEPTSTAVATDHPDVDGADTSQRTAGIETMVESLAARLADNPGDIDGWILLARSYVALERFAEAAEAYKTALPLANDDPILLADYGEVIVMANAGTVTETARTAFTNAKRGDAANPKARFFLGMHKAQSGDVAGALQDWVDLATIGPAGAPWIPAVRSQIERAADDLGVSPADIVPSGEAMAIAARQPAPAAPAAPATPAIAGDVPGPTQDDIAAAQEMSAEDQQAMIRSMVQRLADRLEANPDDAEGWKRLERAYRVLGDTEKADEAAKRAADAAQ